MVWATSLADAVHHDLGLLEQFANLLVAGLAVGALRNVLVAEERHVGAAAVRRLGWSGRRRGRRSAAERRKRRREAAVGRSIRGRCELAHRLGDNVERALLRRHRLLVALLHGLQLGLVMGIELSPPAGRPGTAMFASSSGAPRPDGRWSSDTSTLISRFSWSVEYTKAVLPARSEMRQADVILDQDGVGIGRELAELLLEAGFVLGEVRPASAPPPGAWWLRPRHIRCWSGPVLVEIGIALKVEPAVEHGVGAAGRARTPGSCGSPPRGGSAGSPPRRRCRARPGRACRRRAPPATR